MSSPIFSCPACGGVNRVRADKLASGPKCGRCGEPLPTSGEPLKVSDEQLARIVEGSPVPVLVDFYSDTCPPCRQLAPVLSQLGRKYAGQILVLKVDTSRHQHEAARLGVSAIPAVFLYQGGSVIDRSLGFAPLPRWEQMIRPHLAA